MALPTCTTWLSQHAEPKEQGQVMGNNQSLLVLGEASSAAIGGLIAAIRIPKKTSNNNHPTFLFSPTRFCKCSGRFSREIDLRPRFSINPTTLKKPA